jgi:hypothetical protein
MKSKSLLNYIEESAPYDNFVDRSPSLQEVEPPPPRSAKPDYPHTLKVHLASEQDCHAFAKLMQMALRSDKKDITFVEKSRTHPSRWTFLDLRKSKREKASTQERVETALWGTILPFQNKASPTFIRFNVTIRSEESYIAFARRVKQRISLDTKYIWFPPPREEKSKSFWISKWDQVNPKYPVYIVSKDRADTRFTSKTLERLGVPYYIVIEKQDYDAYSVVIDKSKILVAPFSNHGDGPGRARNLCWDHAKAMGAKRHWVLDDNIDGFYRLHQNKRIRVADGGIFRIAEDFVDRFENIKIAGFNYRFFVAEKSTYPPFVLNTRIYSCLLIDNACRHRWRGRYNEDTDLSLRVLKDGDCTLQFNAFLQGKLGTQTLKGGNTAEFYAREGTWNKSAMLEAMHPDVTKTVWRYGRWHHEVDYRPFKDNTPKQRARSARDELPVYQMELARE